MQLTPKKIAPPKKVQAKKPKAKKTQVVKKQTPKKASSMRKKQLAKLQAQLNKIQSTSQPTSTTTPLPSLPSLSKVKPTSPNFYEQNLIEQLRLQLRLPEGGEVIVDISLNRYGQLLSWTVVQAVSEKNKKYVAKHLPSVTFPSFGKYFPGEHKRAFKLLLKHEMEER